MIIGELQVVHSLADKHCQKDDGLHEAKTTEGVTACPILNIVEHGWGTSKRQISSI